MPEQPHGDQDSAPQYAKEIDYQAGRTLWIESFKAEVDVFKWAVGLIPLLLTVSMTFLTNILADVAPRFPELLYTGWVLLGVAMIVAVLWFNKTREVVDEVSWQWTTEHFDADAGETAFIKAHQYARMASFGRLGLYTTLFLAFVALGSFVGVNLEAKGIDNDGTVTLRTIEAEFVDPDSYELKLEVQTAGDGSAFDIYFSSGNEILPEGGRVGSTGTPTLHSLSFVLDGINVDEPAFIHLVPSDVFFDSDIDLFAQVKDLSISSIPWKPRRPPKPGG